MAAAGRSKASLSSLAGPEAGSDEPTDGDQEFSSDSMSDHTEPALEPARGPAAVVVPGDPAAGELPEASGPREEVFPQAEAQRPGAGRTAPRSGIGFIFKEEMHSEGEMAQRRAVLLERQQRRAEEVKEKKKRRQWHEKESEDNESRPGSSEEHHRSPCPTPPPATTSPFPTPPGTPARWGDFTRGEHNLRHQLKIMADLGKVLQQKPANQGRASNKKTRPRARPRSASRVQPPLSQSLDNGILGSKLTREYSHSTLNLAAGERGSSDSEPAKKPPSAPNSPLRCVSSSRPINTSANPKSQTDGDVCPNGTPPASDYTGPKLFKEPSFKSNKFIIHNALSRCCLAGKVNETQKNKIVEEMEKSPANHFLILFRDASCQFRGVYTMNPDTQELVRLTGVGPRTVGSAQVESIYKYSSDRKQFSAIPSKTVGMSVDAFTIPGPLWHGGGAGGSAGGSRRASVTKKAAVSK